MKPEQIIAETFDPVAFAFPQWKERRDQALEKARIAIENLEAYGFKIEPSKENSDE